MAAIAPHRRGPLLVLLVVALLSSLAAVFAARVTLDQSIEIWFLDDDPDLVTYREFIDRFGADEMAVIGVFSEDAYSPATLAAVDRLSTAAAGVPWAAQARSLTTVDVVEGEGGVVFSGPLVETLPETAEEAADIRRRAEGSAMIAATLVSADGRGTAIAVELVPEANDFARKSEFVHALRDVMETEEAQSGLDLRLGGTPPIDEAFARYSEQDSAILGPLSFLFVVIAAFAMFRRPSAAMAPIAVVGLSLLWTLGLMGALDWQINMVTTVLPVVLLAVGVADAVHVVGDVRHRMAEGATQHQAVHRGARELWMPCAFTSLTTIAGFLSLLLSNLGPIREFALLSAFGVAVAFVLSFTLLPALLLLVPAPSTASLKKGGEAWVGAALERIARPSRSARVVILSVFAVLVGGSVYGLTKLEVGANFMNSFPEDCPERVDNEFIDRELDGTSSLELVVRAPNEGLKDPAVLRRLRALQDWLATIEGVGSVIAVTDALSDVDRVMRHGDPDAGALPSSRAHAAQLYLMLEGVEDFDQQVQENYSVTRVSVRTRLADTKTLNEAMPEIVERLERDFPGDELTVETTGYAWLMNRMDVYLLDSQVRSMSAAFAAIVIMMGLLLRSPRLALFSMVPNLGPIVMGLGFMAAAGIALDAGTVMIGCVSLGLVVDDTVHLLVRFRRNLDGGDSLEDAVAGAVVGAGRPVVITSILLMGGFLILTLGSFAPTVFFGLVTAVVIVLAVICDLVVLPALLLTVGGMGGRR
jgi:uncharacterized protein